MIFAKNEKYEQAILSTLIHIQTDLEADLNLDALAEQVGFSAFLGMVFIGIFMKAREYNTC